MTHDELLEHSALEIAQLNRALLEAETERDALREALWKLRDSTNRALGQLMHASSEADRALEPHPTTPQSEATHG